MTAISENTIQHNRSMRDRHMLGVRRLRLRNRSLKNATCAFSNPPRLFGLEFEQLEHHVPRHLPANEVRLAVPTLPLEATLSGETEVDTRAVAAWVAEHGSIEDKHAWQWWQVEALAGTWKRGGYGYVDDVEDYRDWCRLSA